jgi:hypothetical protein
MGRLALRLVAIAWLLAAAPIELATALAGLVRAGATPVGAAGLALVGSRILVVAAGLVLGRQLLQHQPGTRSLAWGWAAADLATLAVVLASARLPSNRAPGDAPLVWVAYAIAAGIVIAAAAPIAAPQTAGHDARD